MKIPSRLLTGLLALAAVGCSQNPAPEAMAPAASQPAAVVPAPLSPVAPPVATTAEASPYKQTIRIFQEFAVVVETNQQSPETGVAECKRFAAVKIPELKTLATQVKAIETSPKAAAFLKEINAANDQIAAATDKVTQIAQEKYGAKGADVMLLLADLALARL